MFLSFDGIPQIAIIVTGDVQRIQDGRTHGIRIIRQYLVVNQFVQFQHQFVELLAGHGFQVHRLILFGRFILRGRFVFVIQAGAFGRSAENHDIDASCDDTSGIQAMKVVNQGPGHLHPAREDRLADLIADGIHQDGRMIEVLVHNSCRISTIIVHKMLGVIVLILGQEPAVKKFIHDVHAQTVTCFEDAFRGCIMGGTDGIEAIRLEDGDAPQRRFLIVAGPKDAIVAVDGTTLEQQRLSINLQSIRAVCDLSDAKLHFPAFQRPPTLFQGDDGCIKRRSFRRP